MGPTPRRLTATSMDIGGNRVTEQRGRGAGTSRMAEPPHLSYVSSALPNPRIHRCWTGMQGGRQGPSGYSRQTATGSSASRDHRPGAAGPLRGRKSNSDPGGTPAACEDRVCARLPSRRTMRAPGHQQHRSPPIQRCREETHAGHQDGGAPPGQVWLGSQLQTCMLGQRAPSQSWLNLHEHSHLHTRRKSPTRGDGQQGQLIPICCLNYGPNTCVPFPTPSP